MAVASSTDAGATSPAVPPAPKWFRRHAVPPAPDWFGTSGQLPPAISEPPPRCVPGDRRAEQEESQPSAPMRLKPVRRCEPAVRRHSPHRALLVGLGTVSVFTAALAVWILAPEQSAPQRERQRDDRSYGNIDDRAGLPVAAIRPTGIPSPPAPNVLSVETRRGIRANPPPRVSPRQQPRKFHAPVAAASRPTAIDSTSTSQKIQKVLAASTPRVVDRPSAKVCTPETCGAAPTLGTALHWVSNANEAARLAKQQGKLVFLIQVSGNFAREEFT